MTRLTFNITAVNTVINLDKTIRFTRLRIVKAYMNNIDLGNTDGQVLVSINSYIQNRFTRSPGNDIMYTFNLLTPQNTVISYDRSTNDWDYLSETGDEVLKILTITLLHPNNTLSFVGGSSFIIELELELDYKVGYEHSTYNRDTYHTQKLMIPS